LSWGWSKCRKRQERSLLKSLDFWILRIRILIRFAAFQRWGKCLGWVEEWMRWWRYEIEECCFYWLGIAHLFIYLCREVYTRLDLMLYSGFIMFQLQGSW
jgi:hypothetical protein